MEYNLGSVPVGQRLTQKDILNKVSDYAIFQKYLGHFTIDEKFCNPLRGEKDPSTKIKYKNGKLKMIDYGDRAYSGDCFDIVAKMYNTSFGGAIDIIARDFGISKFTDPTFSNKTPIVWSAPVQKDDKPPPKIDFIANKIYSARHLGYFENFKVGGERMKADRIFSPKKIWIDNKRMMIDDLCFVYYYPEETKWFKEGSVAIYRPKAAKENKWMKNVNFSYVEHLDKVVGKDRAFLCKSKKERLLMENILETDAIATIQAENMFAFSQEAADTFRNVGTKYYIGDTDPPGKKFSWEMTNEHSFKHVNVPDIYFEKFGFSDFGDWAERRSYDEVENYFFNKRLI